MDVVLSQPREPTASAFILDDDPLLRRYLVRLLQQQGWIVRPFDRADDMLGALDEFERGFLLLDINMPDHNGLEVLKRVQDHRPNLPVIIISGTADVAAAIGAFRGGASNMLQKPFSSEDLLSAIKAVLDEDGLPGQATQTPDIAHDAVLSSREIEVLRSIADGGQSKSIAWKLGISVRTVEMHRSRIIKKLGSRNVAQAVNTARDLGLL